MNKAILRRPQNFAQSSLWFGRLLRKCPNHEEDFANFCGLLRKAELYKLVQTCLKQLDYRNTNLIELATTS